MSASPTLQPDEFGKRIVEIRRQSANNVLTSLQSALGIIDDQAACITALQKALSLKGSAIDRSLRSLGSDVKSIKEKLGIVYADPEGNLDPAVTDPLNGAERSLEHLTKYIDDARKTVRQLIGRHVESTSLSERQRKFQQEGRRALDNATRGDPLKELKSIWEEGLDLISGLCLRHEGLDRGLCRIADAIIVETSWAGIKALTVPGRGGPGHLTSIVHLRFPEWTVWALPLTAHELWHLGRRSMAYPTDATGKAEGNQILNRILEIVGRSDPESQQRLRSSSAQYWNDDELQFCLADVFGVHVMGPAYACAAIWLVLDPAEMASGQRVQSMLRALKTDKAYEEIHNGLEQQWKEASRDTATADLKYGEWIDALLLYLDEVVVKFYIERWKEVRVKWPNALAAGDISRLEPLKTDIRYALAAAWKARLEWPDKHEIISAACLELCNKILDLAPSKELPLGMG